MRTRFGWKHFAWIAGIALAVWVVVEIANAGRDLPNIPTASQSIDLRGGHVTGNRITTKSWTFDYEHAQLSPDGTVGTVDGVRNGIVFRKGKPYLRIAAEHISINTQTLDFTALGKVHVERIGDSQQRSFDTDLVIWTNNAKLLRMDHPSYLHTGDQTLKLETVSIDFGSEKVHLGKIDGAAIIQR